MTKNPIIMITGSKGGAGKSTVAFTVIDRFGADAALVETDTSNADVGKAYKSQNKTAGINLDTREGWIDLTDFVAGTDGPIVINGAARSNIGMRNAPILTNALQELERELVVLFVMSRARDCVELLKEHLDTFPQDRSKTWVVLNRFFGEPGQFTRYQESPQRKRVEEHAGTIAFPVLADRVIDQLNYNRLTIENAANVLSIGSRMELLRWRSEAHDALRPALS